MKEILALLFSNKVEAIKTLAAGMLVVGFVSLMWLSLMNWRGTERYHTPLAPFLQADKSEVTRLTPAAMKDHVYQYNKMLEARAK